MIGIPGETEMSILKTMAMNIKLKPDFVQYSIFQPYPGTILYDECRQRGYLLKDISSVKDFFSESVISTEYIDPKAIKRLLTLTRFICIFKIFFDLLRKKDEKSIVAFLAFLYCTNIIGLLHLIDFLLNKRREVLIKLRKFW